VSTNPRIRFPGNCARRLALVPGLAAAFAVFSVGGAEFHVAPAPAGDDTNPGLAAKPFASLEKARDAARAANDPAGSTIILAPGIYRRANTFELDAHDAGLRFSGVGARISGAVAIPYDAVKPVSDPGVLARLLPEVREQLLEIDLHALGIPDFGDFGPRGFRHPYIPAPLELIIDGVPLDIARWPNAGQPGEPMGKVIDRGPVTRYGQKPVRGGTFMFETDRPARWTQADDIWITGFFANGYADNTVKVKSFDLATKTLTSVHPHMYGFQSGRPWNRWTALNLLEEIDMPGEFVADKKTGKAYFLPPTGKEIAKSLIEATVLKEPLLAIENATDVVLDGIALENGRGIGVYIERGANNRVQNCELRNFGIVAACIGKGITPDPNYSHSYTAQPLSRALGSWHEHIYDNTTLNRDAGTGHGIVNCEIHHTGAGAISLGGGDRISLTPAGNFVENCDIHHFNRWDRTYKAGVNIDGVGNIVRHCNIHDCPGSALYLHGNDHLIEFNEIHNVLMEGDDMGAFYMGRDPSERGNVLRYNFWHDLAPAHSTFAIHFDDAGGDGTLVHGNIFLRTGHRAVFNYYGGSDITVSNNLFIDCPPLVLMSPNCPHRTSGLFNQRLKAVGYDSPRWCERYPGFASYLGDCASMPRNDLFENNLFASTGISAGKGIIYQNNRETTDHSFFTEATPGQPVFKPDLSTGIPGFEPIPFGKIAGLDGMPVGNIK
jgi:hypothetical protein